MPLATGVAGAGLYDWTAGELRAVSVRPSAEGGAVVSGQPGSGAHSTRKAISDDGSRVFWSEGNSALYVRDLTRQETARLDVVQEGAFGTGSAQPLFEGANAAGTVAFFTDTQNLTEDANATGADLYRCEVTTTGGELGCNLTDLTAHGGEDAEVQGVVSGMSDDGTHVYFVARGVLDGAPNAEGEGAIAGQPDLYLWQQGAGIRFVASLSEADRLDWGGANRFAAETSAAASPSGRYFAFMSVRSLTGYDNRDAITGQHVQEVFQYDAATGSLTCASCNPSGAAPESQLGDAEGAATSVLSDPQRLWEGTPVAAILPEATSLGLHSTPSPYRPRAVQDNGRLFFNAVDPLVPADSNGSWDVYEYEPTEIGDCSASSGGAATSLSGGGCVSLISSGTGAGESGFLDASEGGEDAFFITAASLSVTDEDAVNDVYDARVDGTPATLPSHSECQGEACQPPALAPNDATPASASFRGEGNLKPLARKRCGTGKRTTRRKGRVRCVPRRPRQHHRAHRRHRRAHHNDGGAHR